MPSIPGERRLAGKWLNLSLPAKGGVIVAIPVVCTFAMLGLLADSQRKVESAHRWLAHAEQALAESRDILAEALSAESTARGYLASGNPGFLDLHQTSRRRLSEGFDRILALTADDPVQQEHIRHAVRLLREEIAAFDSQLRNQAGDAERAVDTSHRRIDTLRAEVAEFETEELRLLEQRRSETLRQRDTLRLALWGFCLGGVLSAVLGSWLFTSGVKHRLDRIAENAARFARRESDGPVDRGRDTIGRLEETLIGATRATLEREQRLAETAAELERAKLAAEAAVKAKTEFVSTVSHEIRSPVNSLLGAAELLAGTPLNPAQQEYVRILESAGNNLLSVINQVLDHAKIEAGRLELETTPFDLDALLDRATGLMSAAVSKKGLELLSKRAPDTPRRLIGDPSRLQRVLINLISNAIKFTEVGLIAVKVERATVQGMLHFSVADTGIGIPREKQAAIFQKFAQAESSTTRQYGGTGLGLAIAKHIVELMGGRMWVESDEGAGSTFHFTAALPEAPALEPLPEAPAAAPEADGAGGEWPRVRVLLAEDSASSVSLIRAYLAGTGCDLEVAGDGEAALARLAERRYDLVLMDVQMPKLDGYEAMRRLRERERAEGLPRTPIVAVTAHAFQEDVDNAIKAGADAQLTKPFRRESLLDAIELYRRPEGGRDSRVSVPGFLREMAPEFLRRQRSGLLAVAASLKNGEFDPIQSFAHNMKGCGKSFGFPRLSELGREMERAAKDRDAETLRRRMVELREYLTEVDVA